MIYTEEDLKQAYAMGYNEAVDDVNAYIESCNEKYDDDEDYSAVEAAIMNESNRIHEENTYKDSVKIYNQLPNYEKVLVAPRGRFVNSPALLVRVSNNTGFCKITKYQNNPEIGFVTIAVSPKYRHQGVSDKLLNEAIKKSKEKGITKLIYTLKIDNIPSKKLAKRNGFKFKKRTNNELIYEKNI